MVATSNIWITLEHFTCSGCGVVYGIDSQYVAARRRDGKSWTCPNGCVRVFRETNEMRLQAQLDQAQADARWQRQQADRAREDAAYERRCAAAARGVVTKLRKRIANGVCPCCNRSFEQVARHIRTQHPAWLEEHPEVLTRA